MSHPYSDLPSNRYWRRSARAWQDGDYSGLFTPKFEVRRSTRIATAGSCFAQHIGAHFRKRDYAYLDLEPAPGLLPVELRPSFGYEIFSCRYGNIYTSRQLLQLIQRAHGRRDTNPIWEQGGRFYDGLRPSIEPGGFASLEELLSSRDAHLKAVRKMFRQVDLFVFTLGLTECWFDLQNQTAYPICPGTVAGQFDASEYYFYNLGYDDVLSDMRRVITWAQKQNPEIKILLTVSPVPLAATATAGHVVTATTHSKAILRAVAGQLYLEYDCVDYFPSYEIITSTLSKGDHYEADTRNVTSAGVSTVMQCFFAAFGESEVTQSTAIKDTARRDAADRAMMREVELICDEATLDRSGAE